jgi:anti-sigma factor ChrR (cupin superfamily)
MDHDEAESKFNDYFKGRLDREAARELAVHFKSCEACRSRIRLQKAVVQGRKSESDRGMASPEIQAQMGRNRDLLIKILLVMLLAWLVYKFKR